MFLSNMSKGGRVTSNFISIIMIIMMLIIIRVIIIMIIIIMIAMDSAFRTCPTEEKRVRFLKDASQET